MSYRKESATERLYNLFNTPGVEHAEGFVLGSTGFETTNGLLGACTWLRKTNRMNIQRKKNKITKEKVYTRIW